MAANQLTERFIDLFNILKKIKGLPANKILASELGYKTGNSITEISKGRQNITLKAVQAFCDIYGKKYGFSIDYFIRSEGSQSEIKTLIEEERITREFYMDQFAELKMELAELKGQSFSREDYRKKLSAKLKAKLQGD
ncbi:MULTISPECIES: hypothetical protein [unclassified Chitinophaga]|uniref:hypothetical protein n=1 Tax=unclassified Chitinophaga TaxID=2619133 RepID=UPI0009C91E7C|nr:MULTISPECIES: hypothetical protein [unclassified Chitinophaga]OMP76430.1 hypothetical protein BW716_24815 [[Flexibacter] sp. ATCC 35208]WPV66182.1 hypothetical protein QQL36_30765 [Chitinophaga sp. LS1]